MTTSQNLREPSLKRSYNTQNRYFAPPPPPIKRQRFEGRSEKFEAFGKFLSTSLCDLSENKALELVQKFTSDLVKAFLTPEEKKRPPMVATQNGNNISSSATTKENGHLNNGLDDSSDEDDDEDEDMEDDVQIL